MEPMVLNQLALGYSFLSFRSTIKGNTGRSEAKKYSITRHKLHLYSIQQRIRNVTYSINKIPCAHPTIFTACGNSKKYLSGMAMASNKTYDIPSSNATVANVLIFRFMIG